MSPHPLPEVLAFYFGGEVGIKIITHLQPEMVHFSLPPFSAA